MDACVPIKAPVAGISCGLITEGDRWMTMLDIQGVEDFHGDMDFKVGGTRRGITAIQMDIKIDGLTYENVKEALEKCRKGRLYILDEIIKPCIAEPRKEPVSYTHLDVYKRQAGAVCRTAAHRPWRSRPDGWPFRCRLSRPPPRRAGSAPC